MDCTSHYITAAGPSIGRKPNKGRDVGVSRGGRERKREEHDRREKEMKKTYQMKQCATAREIREEREKEGGSEKWRENTAIQLCVCNSSGTVAARSSDGSDFSQLLLISNVWGLE